LPLPEEIEVNQKELFCEGVNVLCIECAWAKLLDIADAGVTRGETLLHIATKLLEKHPDEQLGAAIARQTEAFKILRADVEEMRGGTLTTAGDVTVHLMCGSIDSPLRGHGSGVIGWRIVRG
jgi:hypothetical protein